MFCVPEACPHVLFIVWFGGHSCLLFQNDVYAWFANDSLGKEPPYALCEDLSEASTVRTSYIAEPILLNYRKRSASRLCVLLTVRPQPCFIVGLHSVWMGSTYEGSVHMTYVCVLVSYVQVCMCY